ARAPRWRRGREGRARTSRTPRGPLAAGPSPRARLRRRRGSGLPDPVAFLVFLARAAEAGIVAADLLDVGQGLHGGPAARQNAAAGSDGLLRRSRRVREPRRRIVLHP